MLKRLSIAATSPHARAEGTLQRSGLCGKPAWLAAASGLVALSLTGPALAAFPFIGELVTAQAAINLRLHGDADAALLTTIPAGSAFELEICTVPNGWCKVRFAGQVGWLAGEFVDVTFEGNATTLAGAYQQHWAVLMAPPVSSIVSRITQIVAWGDSLTAGAGSTAGSYTDLLRQKHPGVRFDNRGWAARNRTRSPTACWTALSPRIRAC